MDLWDALVPGFGVRVTTRGVKTFFVRYRANGAQRRMKLGRYPVLSLAAARKRAKAVLTEAAAGADPALELHSRRAADATFAALAREVLDAKAKTTRPKTHHERERILRVELLPAWKARPAASITRREVQLLVERIAERAPILANRVLEVINIIFNEGLRRGFPTLEANPAHLIRPPAVENGRKRFLTSDEIRTVWRTLESEFVITRGIFRFALLTAQRAGAVLALRWTDIDANNVWRTPATVFKGKRDQLVPLSPEALAILEDVRPLSGSHEYVFPGQNGRPRANINNALQRICRNSGLPGWTVHDFRTTFRTHAVRATEDGGLAIAPHVADAVLGHKEASLGFDRYTGEPERYQLAEKRDALKRWGTFVAAAVERADD
jgi:integrase